MTLELFPDVVRYSQLVQALQPLLGFPENLVDPEIHKQTHYDHDHDYYKLDRKTLKLKYT